MEMNYDTCVTWLKPKPKPNPKFNSKPIAVSYQKQRLAATGTKWNRQLATGSSNMATGNDNWQHGKMGLVAATHSFKCHFKLKWKFMAFYLHCARGAATVLIFCLYLYLSVYLHTINWGTFALEGVCETTATTTIQWLQSSKAKSNLKFKLFKAEFFSFQCYFFLLAMSLH